MQHKGSAPGTDPGAQLQTCPSPNQRSPHSHEYPSAVSVHSARGWQSCVPCRHSSVQSQESNTGVVPTGVAPEHLPKSCRFTDCDMFVVLGTFAGLDRSPRRSKHFRERGNSAAWRAARCLLFCNNAQASRFSRRRALTRDEAALVRCHPASHLSSY